MAERQQSPLSGNQTSLENNDAYFELPSSISHAQNMSRDSILHRGMEMMGNSLKAHRACNEAIIFVYGLSGAGKTASLNHLFGFNLIDIEQDKASHTKLVTEYVARMESHKWRVKNLHIGFLDMPGWDDTDGMEQDIRNVATIDHFIVNHRYLGSLVYKCYPSIVMVAINATDKRLKGEGARVPRMFRVLTNLNIIDKKRPNLLILLTHVMAVGRRNFKVRLEETIKTVRELALQHLEVEPAIVYVENDWEEYEEKDEKKGDWTVLRDGTLQPKNVFEAMMRLTSEHKDEVGQEAIRLYFASRGSNKPEVRSQSHSDRVSRDRMKKWRTIIQETFPSTPSNEVSSALESYAHSHPQPFPPSTLYNLMVELSNNNLTHLDMLRALSLNQVQRQLSPFNLSQLECQALMEACGVKPPQWTHSLQHIGFGVNTRGGSSLETPPRICYSPVLTMTGDCYQEGELNIPGCMQVVIPTEKRRVECKRMEPMAPHTDKRGRAGHPVKYQFQITQCVCYIKLCLSNRQELISQLSPAFKAAVAALPESSLEGESQQVRQEYHHFFNTYGHFVIVACECGGAVQGEMELVERDANDLQLIKSCINNHIDRLEAADEKADRAVYFEGNTREVQNKLSSDDPVVSWKSAILGDELHLLQSVCRASLSWRGGTTPPGCTLSSLTPHTWKQWTASLHTHPAPPDYSQLDMDTLLPVYDFVTLLEEPLKHTQVKQAVLLLHPEFDQSSISSLTMEKLIVSPESSNESDSVYCNREELAEKHISETLMIAPGGFPEDAQCLRGDWNNYGAVNIRDVALGDTILCRDPWWIRFEDVIQVNRNKEEEDKEFKYIEITHQYGELLVGSHHTILVKIPFKPPEFIIAKNISPGSVIYYVDHVKKKTLKSKVNYIDTHKGKGHYSVKQRENFGKVVVNQVVTGDEEASCFPGIAIVTLRGGRKVRMDEVKVGDHVLSLHPRTGKPIYSKVYLWGHRDPHVTATFIHITHPHGHLHVSANHLILSGEQRRPVPADHLAVGDTIHSFLSSAATTATSVHVSHIHTCTHVGLYAPFTNNGLIVVDGVACSVYTRLSPPLITRTCSHTHVCAILTGGLVARFGMHQVGECVMTPVRVACKFPMGSLILNKQMDATTHIHKYCQWLMKMTI